MVPLEETLRTWHWAMPAADRAPVEIIASDRAEDRERAA
jgi:hypothetical protein